MSPMHTLVIALVWVIQWLSPTGAFIPSIDDYECQDTVSLNKSSFKFVPTLSNVGGDAWRLSYDITWDPPAVEGTLIFVMNITFENRTHQLQNWNSTSCKSTLKSVFEQSKSVELRDKPAFKVSSAPFTHRGLFRVGYGITSAQSPWPVSDAINYYFDTPDCYAATGSVAFCSTQDVMTAGQPQSAWLSEWEANNDTTMMKFEWEPPVQLNAVAELVEYAVEINSTDGEELFTDRVTANEESSISSWMVVTKNGSSVIEADETYVLTVTPYVRYTDEPNNDSLPLISGRSIIYNFTAGPIPEPVTTTESNDVTEPSEGIVGETKPATAQPEETSSLVLILCLVAALCIFLIGLVLFRRWRRKKKIGVFKSLRRISYSKRSVKEKRVLDPLLQDKEISPHQITLDKKIGEGQFGIVHKGILTGVDGRTDGMPVAIKTTKVGAFSELNEDLLNEIKLLADVGEHPNILGLVACCSVTEPFYLITEYMPNGDLRSFLRKFREDNDKDCDPTHDMNETKQIVIARDIAMGMAHIQERRFYHGDLAARNVLVGEDMSIKVSDFGLADDIYTRGYKRRAAEQKIPIKWCSLEAILNGVCSSEGDAWSFGIVLYEIFTLGGTPYPGMAPRFLVSLLKQGYRMDQPTSCPDDVFQLMGSCWNDDPEARPRFTYITEKLEEMLVARADYVQPEDLEEVPEDRPVSTEVMEEQDRKPMGDLAPINDEHNEVNLDQLQDALNYKPDQPTENGDEVV